MLFFDRTALHNIKLFWRWLEPKDREQDDELKEALRQRRLRRLTVNSPELAHIWLLIGKGTSSTGAESLLERYPEALLPEEFNRNVGIEIGYQRPWNCLCCGERIEP